MHKITYEELQPMLRANPTNILPIDRSDPMWENWMALFGCLVTEEDKSVNYWIKTLGLSEGRLSRKELKKESNLLYLKFRKLVDEWEESDDISEMISMIESLNVYRELGYEFGELEDGYLIVYRKGGKINGQ